MGKQMVANRHGLLYLFFLVEFQGDDPGGAGSFWVATNQCLGEAATCLNMNEHLNALLRQVEDEKVEVPTMRNVVFTMSGTEARLHISWKHDAVSYPMARVEDFALQKPAVYLDFENMYETSSSGEEANVLKTFTMSWSFSIKPAWKSPRRQNASNQMLLLSITIPNGEEVQGCRQRIDRGTLENSLI